MCVRAYRCRGTYRVLGSLAQLGGVLLWEVVPPAQGELPDEDRSPVVGPHGDLETDDLELTFTRDHAPPRRAVLEDALSRSDPGRPGSEGVQSLFTFTGIWRF